MKVGDLVRNIYTEEIGFVSMVHHDQDYVDVDWSYLVPKEHLEVLSENR